MLYYLATAADGGNDSNSGLSSSSPWLTPNHALNCGDKIIAKASVVYDGNNFGSGSWGEVTCPSNDNVAWLACEVFDACKINTGNLSGAMVVSANYWGIQGWEVTATGTFGSCFAATPPTSSASIHHIIFANNVANGCMANGFTSYQNGNASVDYFVVVGNIAYNAAQGSAFCYSGISVAAPANSDAAPGTHIYIAGNLSYGNRNPSVCNGGVPTDGNGIIFDSFKNLGYNQQAVIDNNVSMLNGGRGIEVGGSGSTIAKIYVRQNTTYGNNSDMNQNATECGEVFLQNSNLIKVTDGLSITNAANGCGSSPIYAYYVANGNATDTVSSSWGYSATGTNDAVVSSPGFTYGISNVFGVSPNVSAIAISLGPNCGSFSNAPSCAASIASEVVPSNPVAKSYGYQTPNTAQVVDPLFPKWLCNTNLPPGLVTMGCLSEPGGSQPLQKIVFPSEVMKIVAYSQNTDGTLSPTNVAQTGLGIAVNPNQVKKVWFFSQNSDGTLSPTSL